MVDTKSSIYWQLSGVYWFYFAVLGALIPFVGLYLEALGFNTAEIGELIAVIMATKIIAPNMWGWLVDRGSNRLLIIRLGALLSVLFFTGIFLSHHYWWLFIVFLAFSFFWNAILPQFEALTLNHLGDDHHRYSLIRLWGSIGFIVTVVVLGWLFNHISIENLPWFIFFLLSGIFFSMFFVKDKNSSHHHLEHEPLRKLLCKQEIVALFVVCFLVQVSHGPYYSFFSIYAAENHYSNSYIGFLWAVGVMSEVVAFTLLPKWIEKFGLRKLLLFSLLTGTLRWIVIAYFIDVPWLLTINQIFHASTFGIYHVVVIALVHQYFVGRNQGMGQSLYSSLSFGLGGAVGSLYAGYTWELSGPVTTYMVAAIVSILGFAVSYKYLKCKG